MYAYFRIIDQEEGMSASVLVSGGAGYIGSHVVLELIRKGYKVHVLDDLSQGHRDSVPSDIITVGDISDGELLKSVVREREINAVMHFAAKTLVSESVENPRKYMNDNTVKTFQFLNCLMDEGVEKFVFSSTAAVYGEPEEVPITEEHPKNPVNMYGESKLMLEKILKYYDSAYKLRYISLRYFNASGAELEGRIGEDHDPETHLIPLVLQAALGKREFVEIYGTDYPTRDGTCVRDYVHVLDLAQAHVKALDALLKGCRSEAYNLGSERGFTVKEVIETASRVTGIDIPYRPAARRPGDPSALIASSKRIKTELGWAPQYDDLEVIVETAWKWHKNNPDGFERINR